MLELLLMVAVLLYCIALGLAIPVLALCLVLLAERLMHRLSVR